MGRGDRVGILLPNCVEALDFLFGAMKGVRQNLKFDSELLFVAALFHDLGLVDAYHTEAKRFEVDGADAAREFLKSHGIPEPKADLVWEAIALHTTHGVPEFMKPDERGPRYPISIGAGEGGSRNHWSANTLHQLEQIGAMWRF